MTAAAESHAAGSSTATNTAGGADLVRQVIVLAAVSFMLVAAAVGTGALGGTPVQDVQNGALDSDGSYLAPARAAFSIWSVVYVLLVAYAVWQALPSQRTDARQRAIGWWISLSAVLNGLWLVTAQYATLGLTVVAIFALVAALGVAFQRTVAVPAARAIDAVLIDGTTGLHLGWVTLAAVANTSAWLTERGADAAWPGVWGVGVLVVVATIGIAIPLASGGRFAPSLALAWGLVWLAVGRLTGEPESTQIAVSALCVAVLVLLVPLVMLLRRGGAPIRP